MMQYNKALGYVKKHPGAQHGQVWVRTSLFSFDFCNIALLELKGAEFSWSKWTKVRRIYRYISKKIRGNPLKLHFGWVLLNRPLFKNSRTSSRCEFTDPRLFLLHAVRGPHISVPRGRRLVGRRGYGVQGSLQFSEDCRLRSLHACYLSTARTSSKLSPISR